MERARLPSSLGKKHPWWGEYQGHRYNAKRDGKEFLLTFEEWLTIWQESGHLHERGRKRGQYVMTRYGDKGAYVVGNVRIMTVTENNKEQWANPETRASMIAKSSISHTGKSPSPETREKLREAGLGRIYTPETISKMVESQKRRREENPTVSAETREKLRKSRLGQKHSEETKAKIGEAHKGRKASPETLEKMRQANIGRKHTPETLEKMSEVQSGRKHTPEHNAKMSEAMKESWRRKKETLRKRDD